MIATGIIIAFLIQTKNKESVSSQRSEARVAKVVPVVKAAEPETEESTVLSPDGQMSIVMKKVTNENSSVYVFSVNDVETNMSEEIYTTEGLGEEFSLSANSFSPDNRYVFVNQVASGSATALVFRTSGEEFGDEKYIDVLSVFDKKETGNTLIKITGWDSSTLLHLFTENDGTSGPSYWFEIPSGAAIRLNSK